MSISTGGATMPRRILTTRSVPPPSGMLAGFSERAAMTSSSDFGLSTRNSGRVSITISSRGTDSLRHPEVPAVGGPRRMNGHGRHPRMPGLPDIRFDMRKSARADLRWLASLAPQDDGSDSFPVTFSPPLLDRLENPIGRHRKIVEPNPDRVGDRIGECRQERRQGSA